MSIRDSDVQRVREATDIVALIARRVSLKRVGGRHVGLCPFHTEKTPSFSVDPSQGFYHCFGCKASGDAITFLRETEQLDFTDAVEQLAAAANITLTYDAPGAQRANQRRKELMELLEVAARFYHERLLSDHDAGPARAYLRRRGYDRDTVVKWRLGYAPPLWDALCQHLGVPAALLAAAGLAYADSRRGPGPRRDGDTSGEDSDASSDDAETAGRASDFFRDRIMFPICDASGRVVSFAGRVLPRPDEAPSKGPKYKNTAGTAVYDKSKVLYGLHLAKHAARTADRIVVCEGYTDVIGCDLAGISEAVATCGTALTQQHAELLSRSAKRIVLAFDADAAGQTATERVHQWERTYALDVFVAALPPGSDPGDLAETNPPALRRALEEAQPLHSFRAERILHRAELDSPAGRDRAADEAAEVLAVYPADVLNDNDLEPIARRIPMEAADLRRRVDAARDRLAQRPASSAPDPHDAPLPPERDEGYYEHENEGDFDPTGSAEGGPAETRLSRRVQVQIERSSRRRARRERLLLEAAMAPEGDAVSLITPELFVSNTALEAFSHIASDAERRHDEAVPNETDLEGGESESPGADVRDLLVAAAAGGEKLSREEALGRVAIELRHFVNETVRRISEGADIPFTTLNVDATQAERYHFRRSWLRWLSQREVELRDVNQQVGAASAVASWIQGVIEAAESEPVDSALHD